MINYKNKGNKIEFKISQTEFYTTFSKEHEESIKNQQKNNFKKLSPNSAILSFENSSGTGSFATKKQEIRTSKNLPVDKIEPVLLFKDGTKQIVDGQISIKIQPKADIKSIASNWNFIIEKNELDKNVYLLKSDSYSTDEIFHIVNELQNNKDIEFAEPNFIRLIAPNTSDPYFNTQWALKNQGYNGGTVGADMKVENAWNYVTGNNIKVAIIDTGVDLTHPDLQGNLLAGYDATGGNNNGNQTGNAHGTACAGIVAAKANNNIGISGVAYNAKIIPVKVFPSSGSPTDAMLANGINWAWQNGADILSNSWGGGSASSTIINAINNAVNNGRSGKGSVVLFSSGNNDGAVSFPANQSNVIAVGAISMCDQRKTLSSCDGESWWGSNYGSEIDVIAPGVMITTSDISGSAGYSSGDYTSSFNGTSSACPNAAGVVALILSANPNLTQAQARAFLEKNTDKVFPSTYAYQSNSNYPNGTWNNQVGYGRLNALKAVEDVFFGNVFLNGTNSTCNSQQIFTLSQVPNNLSPIWSHSTNLTKISETSSTITVIPNNGASGNAFVKATFGSKEIIKYFWISKPITQLNYESTNNYVHLNLLGLNGTDINSQGITNVTWQKLYDSGGCVGSLSAGNGFTAVGHGNCFSWNIRARITITNSCGSQVIEQDITPRAPDPCDNYKITSTNNSSYRIILPCERSGYNSTPVEKSNLKIIVTDALGNIVINTNQTEFNLQNRIKGTYYAKIIKEGKIVHSQTLIKN